MISYSMRHIFTENDLALLAFAKRAVALAPHELYVEETSRKTREVRCHELARAVADVMALGRTNGSREIPPGFCVADGCRGPVEHSWIFYHWGGETRILDVYTPGTTEQVQIVDPRSTGKLYYTSDLIESVRSNDVESLVMAMRPALLTST